MMNIEQACAAFKVLLEEQQARIANADETKKDFSKIMYMPFLEKSFFSMQI